MHIYMVMGILYFIRIVFKMRFNSNSQRVTVSNKQKRKKKETNTYKQSNTLIHK